VQFPHSLKKTENLDSVSFYIAHFSKKNFDANKNQFENKVLQKILRPTELTR